jgi:hypothetical protein
MPSKVDKLETRVAELERELRDLKTQFASGKRVPWYRQIAGAFKDDPVFEEIMRLGAAIRKADRKRGR